ncbi:MAG: hypothetical protein P1T08_08855 [Acidimicrobiia bacterium]|nr:hypothetical protein [Acidimicrobiia bacterium]
MRNTGSFLIDQPGPIPWQLPEVGRGSFQACDLFLGKGAHPLEVAVATAPTRPNVSDVRQLWKRRKDNRAAPLLLIVLYQGAHGLRAAMCGPTGDNPPVQDDRDPGQAERIATSALAEPNRNAAIRFLHEVLPESDSDLAGIRNAGMFATHQLKDGVPTRPDWAAMTKTGQTALNKRGQDLIRSLGFIIDQLGAATSVLRLEDNGAKTAVAIFLDENETPEGAAPRFGGTSPISHALAQADAESLPYVVLTRGSQIRVYAARKHTGVGRKGRAETFIEANLALLPDDLAGYLPLLFGADALRPEGSFEQILEESQRFASGLGERLRDRVYNQVVPHLARVVAAHHKANGSTVTEQDLADLYELAMVILFRLLFVAYAEDKDLLPYRSNGLYQRNALKTLAAGLADRVNQDHTDFDPAATDMGDQIRSLSKAVDQGNRDWAVPAYNGGMFSSDPDISQVGARLAELSLTNAEIGPALLALLVDRTDEDVHGPVDFRSLSVREFGTIYEGLLESNLSVAPSNLTVASDGAYVPAGDRDEVVVVEGEIYLHNRSGARKATGSYFTKPFAVEHLLEHALEPALDDHLKRLRELTDAGEEHKAADAFFDFRCADIAMGSGHFLVAAVDHIEARLSSFLAEHPIPGVVNELERIRAAAFENLGPDLADAYEIEQASLLRRQVARRCIYGVDLNLIAVELARLGMWIHTFVPGLPLSFLDHNLVQGNSLTGIGTIDEALDILVPETGRTGTPSLLRSQIEGWLERAEDALSRLGRISDATAREIRDARAAHDQATEAVEPARKLFDLLIAVRIGAIPRFEDVSDETLAHPQLKEAVGLASQLGALHFPIAFPEVFSRGRPGFDCIVGNPPWEEVKTEELAFWNLHFPGLKGMAKTLQKSQIRLNRAQRPDLVAEYETQLAESDAVRHALLAGPYDGMSEGDPDLYKAFAWRFWQLSHEDGFVGVVLPKSILATKGSAPWRRTVLPRSHTTIDLCRNQNEWLFTDVNPGYPIALVEFVKGFADGDLTIRGTHASVDELLEARRLPGGVLRVDRLALIDPLICVPAVESRAEVELLGALLEHPAFGQPDRPDFRARPHTELHVTNDERWFSDAGDEIYNHLNIERHRFARETGAFAHGDFNAIAEDLQRQRMRLARHQRSPFSEMAPEWAANPKSLPARNPRIAYRAIIHASNPRKMWAALVPPRHLLTNAAPYLLFPRGGVTEQAYVLGMLNSSVCDWFGHLRIVLNLNYFILNSVPVPLLRRSERVDRFIGIAAGLAITEAHDWGEWTSIAHDPGTDVTSAYAELDAIAFLEYGLEEGHKALVWTEEGDVAHPPRDLVESFIKRWR